MGTPENAYFSTLPTHVFRVSPWLMLPYRWLWNMHSISTYPRVRTSAFHVTIRHFVYHDSEWSKTPRKHGHFVCQKWSFFVDETQKCRKMTFFGCSKKRHQKWTIFWLSFSCVISGCQEMTSQTMPSLTNPSICLSEMRVILRPKMGHFPYQPLPRARATVYI